MNLSGNYTQIKNKGPTIQNQSSKPFTYEDEGENKS